MRVNFSARSGPPGKMMGQEVEYAQQVGSTLRKIFVYFKRERSTLFFLFFSVIVVTVCSLLAPFLQGKAIDGMQMRRWQIVINYGKILLGVYLIHVLAQLIQSLLAAKVSQKVGKQLRCDLFEKIDTLPIPYLDTHSNGDIMSRMTNDAENVATTISQSLGSLLSGVLSITGTVILMFSYCWQLTLITMVSVILTVFVTKEMSKIMRTVYRKKAFILGRLNGHGEEMITGYRSIVSFHKQEEVAKEFDEISDELKKVGMKAEILGGAMGPIMNSISNISFVIVAAFGGYFAYTGLITIGTVSAFIIYAKQFSRPINEIAQLYQTVQTAIAGAERIFVLLEEPKEDDRGEIVLENFQGKISFEGINFSYEPGKQVLYDFNLDIEPGQKIALVGATGSGKTTIVNLLMRFYQPQQGKIIIDGVDIFDMKKKELRGQMAIVLQDTVLFSDTIENNLKYGNASATEKEMEEAIKVSNLSSFIESLPEKLNTHLTQAGAAWSQGQRQLLSIARAILADPKILILDEATSSVDTRTEKKIQDAMVKLMKNRTSVIIAHRLSTIRDADKIIVMEKGRIAEIGDHETLLTKKGKYYELYRTQFQGKEI